MRTRGKSDDIWLIHRASASTALSFSRIQISCNSFAGASSTPDPPPITAANRSINLPASTDRDIPSARRRGSRERTAPNGRPCCETVTSKTGTSAASATLAISLKRAVFPIPSGPSTTIVAQGLPAGSPHSEAIAEPIRTFSFSRPTNPGLGSRSTGSVAAPGSFSTKPRAASPADVYR